MLLRDYNEYEELKLVRLGAEYFSARDKAFTEGLNVPGYIVGSKGFRPDIQKPRQMENAVRDI
jgi:hypothetical protein